MGLIEFIPSRPYTLGIEIEFQVLDEQNLNLAPLSRPIMATVPERFQERVAEEFLQSILEVRTGICSSVDEAADDLEATIRAVESAARDHGCLLYASSLHPFADPDHQVLSFGERYQRIMRELQFVGRQFICQGLHVHVGLDDRDRAVQVCDAIQVYLPILLSLSTSSPFFRGEDTGFCSYRTKLFEMLPMAGLTCFHGSWNELVEEVDSLARYQIIREFRDLWWDVRPNPGFGTVEVRICDLPSRFSHVLALAALIQAMAAALAEDAVRARQVSMQILNCNKWQACRHGLAGRFTDPLGLLEIATMPMERAVRLLADRLEPWLQRFGTTGYLEQVDDIIEHGTSAALQRAYCGPTGDFRAMIERLHRGFWA